jgi:ribonuclease D
MLDEGGSSFPARESALQEAGYTTRTIRTETIGANAYKANLRLIQISAPEP